MPGNIHVTSAASHYLDHAKNTRLVAGRGAQRIRHAPGNSLSGSKHSRPYVLQKSHS